MNHISIALAISGIAYSGAMPPAMVDETVQTAVNLRHDGNIAVAQQAVASLHERIPVACINARRQFNGLLAAMAAA